MKDKSNKEVLFFPNWVDTNSFYPLTGTDALKKDFGFLPSDKIVLYSGAIGEKQGIESIIYSAEKLSYLKDVKFVICGSGPYKEKLNLLKESLNLDNVIFMALQPHEKFNMFLNIADLHLVLQKSNAGDLVMPSKLSTILAVGGLALVTAHPDTSLYNYLSANNMGILIEPENQEVLTKAIEKAIHEDNLEIKKNARTYAVGYLSMDNILARYMQQVDGEDNL